MSARRWGVGALLAMGAAGAVAGIVFWGGFNTAMEATNSMEFCISCHEMKDNVYQEYVKSPHYRNASGVRAICSDCHVPREPLALIKRKFEASFELYHKLVGTIDTPEKFEAKRYELARRVWTRMKETDSLECRNCHHRDAMSAELQTEKAQRRHQKGIDEGLTCIDCHFGIAHSEPQGPEGPRDMKVERNAGLD